MDAVEIIEKDEWERTEAFLAAAYEADYQRVSSSLAYGISADATDDDHITALQIASAQGNLPMMQMLLNCGASVDKCNHCGFTPLLHAARNGKVEAIELLIRHGADPLRTTFYGTTALSLASAGGHFNVIVLLREYASQTRRRAPTPLIAAIAAKQYQIVIHLQFAGIIQHPCRDMFYELDAFHLAEQLMDLKMAVLLRDLGLQLLNQPVICCFATRTPTIQESQMDEISRKKSVDIRCLIRDHQVALVNWVMNLNDFTGLPVGTTPLMYAAITGNISMAETLLRHNCDINAALCGFTPIMIAIVCGNDVLTQYLIRKGASQSTNGCQFSLFELASNSEGISTATIQQLLLGSTHKMRLIERISAILQKISGRGAMSQSAYHQPIKFGKDVGQLSFLQKVTQNMGLKSNWVPEELFDTLVWPEGPCTCFKAINGPDSPISTPTSLLEERIMVTVDEEKQRCLLSDCLIKRIGKDSSLHRSSNYKPPEPLFNINDLHVRQQQCSSISRLQSTLFHFGSGSPKNCSTTSSNSTNLSTMLNSNDWQDSEIPMVRSISELCSTYKYEEKYRDLLDRRCSPDMCQKLEEQEVDCETFLMLTEAEFISFGINPSDARILSSIQKILKEELSKV
ncbi:unnamed protein product [Litomosoides sigmodontis]|uniref:SAM domain-containing protein n=1 Tax=Litomosoides sigmodontis TaxID=42156 RepID=A0A3P6S701_LITSI|nr:unnamed protein product [Litomosoides sigmodontis]